LGMWLLSPSAEVGERMEMISVKVLDTVYREFIRKRAIASAGGCERCLAPKYDIEKEDGQVFPAWKQLQTSHLIPRGNYHVRWDEDNAAGLCGGCHRAIDKHFKAKDEFVKNRLGSRFDLLQARERITGKVDRNAVWVYLREKIKVMEA